jgi:hypothetical protein
MAQTRTITIANAAVMRLLQDLAAMKLITFKEESEAVPEPDSGFEGLPGEAGCAERLAAAEAYRKAGGKYIGLDEFKSRMQAAIARGAAHGR